jgi:hypothetical protein
MPRAAANGPGRCGRHGRGRWRRGGRSRRGFAVRGVAAQDGGRWTRLAHWAVTLATGNVTLPLPPPASTKMLASSWLPSVWLWLAQAAQWSLIEM